MQECKACSEHTLTPPCLYVTKRLHPIRNFLLHDDLLLLITGSALESCVCLELLDRKHWRLLELVKARSPMLVSGDDGKTCQGIANSSRCFHHSFLELKATRYPLLVEYPC